MHRCSPHTACQKEGPSRRKGWVLHSLLRPGSRGNQGTRVRHMANLDFLAPGGCVHLQILT